MIKDKLKNAQTYYNISKYFQTGFNWLLENDLNNLAEGTYDIDGKNIYANIQSYLTKDSAPFEAHQKYADIQFMIKGIEKIGVTDISNCSSLIKYDQNRDIEFFKCIGENQYQTLSEGNFLVFFPHDAHQPALNYSQTPSYVKKVVVKIKL